MEGAKLIGVMTMKEATAWLPVFPDQSLYTSGVCSLYVRLHYPTFLGPWLIENWNSWKPRNRIHRWLTMKFLKANEVWLEYRSGHSIVAMGETVCNKNDNFCYAEGRSWARDRALAKLEEKDD